MAAENNIFAKDGFYWWIGVVEDRMDPLKIGRCRVRILGYHLDNKQVLPTTDLPWAIPLQPITSAAISGKGSTPVGPLEGTWVIGFFADGQDCQQPVIMGTMGGYPPQGSACQGNAKVEQQDQPGVLTDNNGNVINDQNGNPMMATSSTANTAATSSNSISGTLPPLTQQQVQALMDAIAYKESGSQPGGNQNYSVVNQLGYVGKYQFGAPALQTVGYVTKPVSGSVKNADLNGEVWSGKNGVNSLADWKSNKNNCQELAMFDLLKSNYKSLTPQVIDPSGEPGQAGGYLATAHLLGPGGARSLKYGSVGKDANGTTGTYYYTLGAAAVGGETKFPTEQPDSLARQSNTKQYPKNANPAGPLNDPKLGQPDPYADPNSVYPKCEYTARPDTNKLATNDDIEKTIVGLKKKKLATTVGIANSETTWDELAPAYCSKYPFNHVIESESGHVIEMDDTPGRERIHIYHRSGTNIEIDKDGTVRQHVQGDSYEVNIRNKRMYTKGTWDMTIDGPTTLLAKDKADIEIFGKTTVHIHNDVDLDVAGDLRLKAKNIYMESDQDFNIKAGNYLNQQAAGNMSFTSGGNEDHRAGGDFDVDASTVNLNSGVASPTAATATNLDALDEKTPDGKYPEWLKLEECSVEESSAVKNDAGENPDFANEQADAGVYNHIQVEQGNAIVAKGAGQTDILPAISKNSIPVNTSEFKAFTDFPDTTRLSKSFTLGELSNRVPLVSEQAMIQSQRGLTQADIAGNLKALAVNVLDPIKEQYPNMYVTNAYRQDDGSGSQHALGEAADIQFKGASPSDYYGIAQWIKSNIAFDQMILEYKTTGTGNPWIHISHKASGNRPVTAPNKVQTFMNHASVSSYLSDFSS